MPPHLPLAERAAAMRDPQMKATLLSEGDIPPDASGSMENLYGLFGMAAPAMYPLADPVDYEPDVSECLGALAAAEGRALFVGGSTAGNPYDVLGGGGVARKGRERGRDFPHQVICDRIPRGQDDAELAIVKSIHVSGDVGWPWEDVLVGVRRGF